MTEENLQAALKKFEELVREQSARSDRIKAEKDFIDYEKLDKIMRRRRHRADYHQRVGAGA